MKAPTIDRDLENCLEHYAALFDVHCGPVFRFRESWPVSHLTRAQSRAPTQVFGFRRVVTENRSVASAVVAFSRH